MLTDKQEKFATLIVSGLNQSDAYRQSYNAKNYSDKVLWIRASELAANSKVKVRINELKDKVASKVLWSREQSLIRLAEIADRTAHVDKSTGEVTPGAKDSDRINAIKSLNEMLGFNAPVKTENKNITIPNLGDFYKGL